MAPAASVTAFTFEHDSIEIGKDSALLDACHQRYLDAVAHDCGNVPASKPQRLRNRAIVLVDVPAEIGGIIGIDGDDDPLVHQAPQRMVLEIVDDPQSQV